MLDFTWDLFLAPVNCSIEKLSLVVGTSKHQNLRVSTVPCEVWRSGLRYLNSFFLAYSQFTFVLAKLYSHSIFNYWSVQTFPNELLSSLFRSLLWMSCTYAITLLWKWGLTVC